MAKEYDESLLAATRAERVERRSLTRFQRSGSDRCGCGRIFPASSFPFQSPIPFMRFDVTTSVTTVATWTCGRVRAHTHARTLTHRVQAHKQNERVLLECQSGILVFFARTPQNMYVRELHANDRCGNSLWRVSRASPLLASGCQRESLDRRRHGGLIAAWKLTFPF